jgi:UDP-N-acetylglucosamine--N-acetylmuramyl-(pentapeptide) pyrophosphoryl-undecaprenol N-acetylglucosamine transferase
VRVVVAGGGTAGHVSPAIALARALDADDVSFIGTEDGVEASMVPAAGFDLDRIEVAGFDRAKPLSFPKVAGRAAGAVGKARRLLSDRNADVVVGMGGYVSLPVSLAAASRRIPLVLHEQNIVFGLAHRVTRRFARKVAVSFEETLASAGKKGVWTGNPVSSEIVDADLAVERERAHDRFDLDPQRRTVLVFGGSLGAKRVTDAALGLAEGWNERTDLQVLHILGRRGGEQAGPLTDQLIYRTVSYVDRMVEAYAVADVAVCRGGASTVAELTVVGVPSIIVPYPYHRDRQQERHARVLEKAGAAEVLLDEDTSASNLAASIERLLNDPGRLEGMRAAARSLGHPSAARDLAEVVRTVAA